MSGFIKMTKLDFITMKSQFWAYVSLLLIMVLFWMMGSSVIILCVSASLFVALFSYTIFSLQEKNKLDRLYGSVSVTVKDIVLGRYIFAFLNFLLSLLAIIVLYLVTALFQNEVLQINDIAIGVSLALLFFSVVTGVQMPMFFKMGYTKAKIWSLVPFVAATILIILARPLLYSLSGIIKFVLSNQSILIIGCILASCIILFVSYRVSVVAYRKRR